MTTNTSKSPWPSAIGEYARFATTGALNTVVDFLVLNALILAFNPVGGIQGKLYIIFKVISFLLAALNSYFLNKYWVFPVARPQGRVKEGGKFLAVTAIGFLFNISGAFLVFHLLTEAHVFTQYIDANIGAVCGTLLVLVWNYFGYKFFVFKESDL